MAAMIPSVSTASRAADANPSVNASHTTGQGAEFEIMLSSIEACTLKSKNDSDYGVDHGNDGFEVNDDSYTTEQDEVTSTDESDESNDESTEEVSEADLYDILIGILQNLIAEVRLQSMESEVGSMQESLEEKLKKLNELVSTMKGQTSGEPLFDSSAFNNNDGAITNEDQRAVLQQVLKETAPLSNFTEVDKKQLSDLTSILNRELGIKNETTKSITESQREALLEKVQSLFDSENVVVEAKKTQENLSNQLRVDQLFHSLKANVEQEISSTIENPRVTSTADQLIGHLSPEKLESAKYALENLLGSVQTNTSNVSANAGIDSKQNRVMTTQILPRIETALKAGESNFKMTLSPHGLGQVEVKLLQEYGNLKVQLAVSSSLTAELLSAQIDELKKALGTKDIQVTYLGHNQDSADDRNSEFSNEFFKNDEGRKEREGHSQNSENKGKNVSDVGERVEAKLVNPKLREGNLLGRI